MATGAIDPNIRLPLVEYTAANAPTLRTRPKFRLHTVKTGETLFGIAASYQIPGEYLLRVNLSLNKTFEAPEIITAVKKYIDGNKGKLSLPLKPGQIILIPLATPGDTKNRSGAGRIYVYSSDQAMTSYVMPRTEGSTVEQLFAGSGYTEGSMSIEHAGNFVTDHFIETDDDLARQAARQCGPSGNVCLKLLSDIGETTRQRREGIKNQKANYDMDADGFINDFELNALLAGCITAIPHPNQR